MFSRHFVVSKCLNLTNNVAIKITVHDSFCTIAVVSKKFLKAGSLDQK